MTASPAVIAIQHEVAQLNSDLVTAQINTDMINRELRDRNKKLVELLEKGETTGDRLNDLLFRFFCKQIEEETQVKFRAFEQKLQGKRGEFVLVKYPVRVRTRFGGGLCSSDFSTETHFRIGMLMGEELQLTRSSLGGGLLLALPIAQYAQGRWPGSHAFVPVVSQVVEGDLFQWKPEDEPSNFHDFVLEEERYGYRLSVGDAAVNAELKSVEAEKFFNEAAEALGRLVLQPTPAE